MLISADPSLFQVDTFVDRSRKLSVLVIVQPILFFLNMSKSY